ncbi:hypothetical protein BV22DRAFT_434088 [Leucogyrophana mollusca]|uniref:Uncharacterized protein n=1 Tax=Leucogyrophana mollusca TaxID=85980 RepID=A0ACB8BJH1_9AGAM|nr:hypothetical protein BV22DRAFT_434088 [Leucogyrophana mollusca]
MGLSRLIVKDGITYYIILFTLSLLNVLIIATQPERLGLLMATPIRVILSVLTARMVLRMREHNRLAVTGGTTAALGQRTAHSLIFAPIPAPEEEARPDVQDEIEMDVSGWWAEGQGTNWANKNGAGHFQGEQEVSEGDMVFRRSSVDRQSNTSEVARSATTACDDSDPDKVDDTRNPLTGLV